MTTILIRNVFCQPTAGGGASHLRREQTRTQQTAQPNSIRGEHLRAEVPRGVWLTYLKSGSVTKPVSSHKELPGLLCGHARGEEEGRRRVERST